MGQLVAHGASAGRAGVLPAPDRAWQTGLPRWTLRSLANLGAQASQYAVAPGGRILPLQRPIVESNRVGGIRPSLFAAVATAARDASEHDRAWFVHRTTGCFAATLDHRRRRRSAVVH